MHKKPHNIQFRICALALLLTSCAHTRIQSWRGNEFTVCGNQWSKTPDFEKEAATKCRGEFTAIGGHENVAGSNAIYNEYTKTISASNKTEQCIVYECVPFDK